MKKLSSSFVIALFCLSLFLAVANDARAATPKVTIIYPTSHGVSMPTNGVATWQIDDFSGMGECQVGFSSLDNPGARAFGDEMPCSPGIHTYNYHNLTPYTEYNFDIALIIDGNTNDSYSSYFTTGASSETAKTLSISVNNNSMTSGGTASINWNTNISANCGIDYSLNPDLSGGIGTNGNIIQAGLSTNDGKFYHVANLNNLQTDQDYYYQVNCNLPNDNTLYHSEIKKLVKYAASNTQIQTQAQTQILSISVNNNSMTSGGTASINWNTNISANCGIDYSLNPDLSGGIGTNGNIIQAGLSTNDGKFYHVANLNNLQTDQDYYYQVNCNLPNDNTLYHSEIKKLSKYYNNIPTKTAQINQVSGKSSNVQTPNNPVSFSDQADSLNANKIEQLLAEIDSLRNTVAEQANQIKYLNGLVKGVNISADAQNTLNNFITYGSDDNTKKLGAGERAAVIYSYKNAFNKLPTSNTDLTDVIKIASGRWPSATSTAAESKAKISFQKVYRRPADMNNANDNAAVTIMAYGLRQKAQNRNLSSEAVGINTFADIYGHAPSTTEEWNIMQAITYSGASR